MSVTPIHAMRMPRAQTCQVIFLILFILFIVFSTFIFTEKFLFIFVYSIFNRQ